MRVRWLAFLFLVATTPAAALSLVETPTLSDTHPDGLPPIAERLPEEPRIVDLEAEGRRLGKQGGAIRTLIGRMKDCRLINVWGYARLVGYDTKLNLVPDILESVDNEGDRVFTLHLRKGHKWSDGEPFTAEDFRYYWQDIALNPELSPGGPDPFMLVDDQPPAFEVIDETTVRYTWPSPNPMFLPMLAAARDPFIYRPAHYLRKFHQKYGNAEKIAEKVAKKKMRGWAQLHNKMDDMYGGLNPDLPSLQPWVPSADSSEQRMVMVRNPYFHRVDTAGRQLPYVDKVVMDVADGRLIATKAHAGEADLQARGLSFSDITVLKRGEGHAGYRTLLWPISKANEIALYPNLTVTDPGWRALLRDVRFRRALSLGIDRDMINRVLYFGLAEPSNNAVLKESELFTEEYRTRWATYDPAKANALLDEIGLTNRRGDGVRLMPDGRPIEIIVETAGESQEEIDALDLVAETWREIGVGLYPKASDREVIQNRALAGSLVMTASSGYDNGIPTRDMSPAERVPTDSSYLLGMAWGAYMDSHGKNGEPIDYPPVKSLMAAYKLWLHAGSGTERSAAWRDILSIHVDEVLSIGLVAGVRQPIVVKDHLANVPDRGLWGWDPGANFGIYGMDAFFFDNTVTAQRN
jgi:peptide/nickel transport system substrate-binding protein